MNSFELKYEEHGVKFGRVRINDIATDAASQRVPSRSQALAISKDFQWELFGSVPLHDFKNGKYHPSNNNTRILGARLAFPGENIWLPCYLCEKLTPCEAFLGHNEVRKVSPIEKFRNRLNDGHKIAKAVVRLLRRAGIEWTYKLPPKKHHNGLGLTNALPKLYDLHEEFGPEHALQLVVALRAFWSEFPITNRDDDSTYLVENVDPAALRSSFIHGLSTFLRKEKDVDFIYLCNCLWKAHCYGVGHKADDITQQAKRDAQGRGDTWFYFSKRLRKAAKHGATISKKSCPEADWLI